MALCWTDEYYYETEEFRINSRRVRVWGLYAPIHDRSAPKRTFDVEIKSRGRYSARDIEEAIEEERREHALHSY